MSSLNYLKVKFILNSHCYCFSLKAVDFFNEASLIWGIICDVAGEPQAGLGEAFPPGFEYRWAEGGGEAVRVSGPQYISKVLTWVEGELSDPSVFPTVEGENLKVVQIVL